jgi:CP family cyanate transporter-like MFS transporter
MFVILAICLWFPLISGKQRSAEPPTVHISNVFLLRSPLAWQVTFFMGLQSFLFYSMVAWLPEILQADGLSASTAGWMLFLVQIAGLPATFAAPALSDKYADQRRIVAVLGAIYLAGLVGLLYGGPLLLIVFWIILIGIGQGASIGLVLALFGLRTRSSEQASALSGMAQSIGYLLAALGPILIGVLYDKTHSWVVPILLFIAVCVLMIIAGLNAGRNKYV